MKNDATKHMVTLAMLTAMAYALVCLIRIPVFPTAPYLKYEPKDVIIAIGGLLYGPLSAFAICAVTAFLEMVSISDTELIGAVMNILSSASFACTIAFIYKKNRTLVGAVVGLVAGTATMVCTMLLWNWLITPLHTGTPREFIEAMLIPVFLPFNALKAGLNSALVLCLYKPLVGALRQAGLIQQGQNGKSKLGISLFALALLATCILLLLVWKGIL